MSAENKDQEPNLIPRFYSAISIPKNILMEWLQFKYVSMPDQYIKTAIKEVKKRPHITLKYFGDIEKENIWTINEIIFDNLAKLKNATIRINGISLIGHKKSNMALVGLVECSREIVNLRKLLDKSFFNPSELPFFPHVTIMETHKKFQIYRAQKVVEVFGDFKTTKAKIDNIYFADRNHKPIFTLPE